VEVIDAADIWLFCHLACVSAGLGHFGMAGCTNQTNVDLGGGDLDGSTADEEVRGDGTSDGQRLIRPAAARPVVHPVAQARPIQMHVSHPVGSRPCPGDPALVLDVDALWGELSRPPAQWRREPLDALIE
jgi:hypothetical protein